MYYVDKPYLKMKETRWEITVGHRELSISLIPEEK